MITVVNQVSSAWFDNSAGGKEVRLGSGSALGEKGEKIVVGEKKNWASEASRGVVWGEE